MSVDVVAVLVGIVLGWVLGAATFFGLYLGERGRRKDAQRREGVLQVDPTPRATVTPPGGNMPAGTDAEIGEAPDRFVTETMEETGCSEQEAREEWRRLLAGAHGELARGGGMLD